MPYRFLKSDPDTQAGVRRIACEQIDKAIGSLDAASDDRAAAVHDVRKRCKKLRGLIRIVRPSFADYSRHNDTLREIAAPLGSARDMKVMLDTFDAVAGDFEDPLDVAAVAPLRAALEERCDAGRDESAFDARLRTARGQMVAMREDAAGWVLEDDGWKTFARGIGKTYERARRSMRRAAKDPTSENHHEWRKRVKYHWYHTRLLRELWPETMKQRAGKIHLLSALLGDHHDCHVLEEAFRAEPGAFGPTEAIEAFIALTRRRAALLEERAHRLGDRLLADDTEVLVERWGAWWKAWRREGDLHKAALNR